MRKYPQLISFAIIISCLFLLASLFFLSSNSRSLIILELPKFNKRIEITDKNLAKQIQEILDDKALPADYRISNRILIVDSPKESKKLNYFGSSLLSVAEKQLYLAPKELTRQLDSIFTDLEKEFYGEAIPWSEAKLLFSKNKDALVTDLETGLSFNIRRKAGTYHADVQPITAKDTEIMKKIFNGSWSWKRRAIILTVDGKSVAASMNGMPHGAGSIKNNNFPGHFCIHFLASKVHKSNKVDLAHQLMIAKASGKLDDEIFNSTPERLVTIFLTALKQHDWNMASLTLGFEDSKEIDDVLKILQTCEDIKNFMIHGSDRENQKLVQTIPVSLTWKKKGSANYITTKILFTLKKSFLEGEWYISAESIQELR